MGDDPVRDDYDLVKFEVKLKPCCDQLAECRDVVLHCLLHGQMAVPSEEDEGKLHTKLIGILQDKKSEVYLALQRHLRKMEAGVTRFKNIAELVDSLKKCHLINDALAVHTVCRVQLAHVTVYWRNSMWTTTVGNPASVLIRFACLAHGILLPVGYSDGTGCLFSDVELRGAEGSGADMAEVQMQHSEAVMYEEGVLPAKCASGSNQAVSDTQSEIDKRGVPPVQCASASNQAVSDTQSEIDERGVLPVQCVSASNQAVSNTQSKIDEHGVPPVQCASASNQAVSNT